MISRRHFLQASIASSFILSSLGISNSAKVMAKQQISEKNLLDFCFMGASLHKSLFPNETTKVALLNYCVFGLIFPKNLKNSLSGDKIKDVFPSLKALSYACIDL